MYQIVNCAPNTQYNHQQQPFYGPLIQDNPGEPVLSRRTDLLEQTLDFY